MKKLTLFITSLLFTLSIYSLKAVEPCITNAVFTPANTSPYGCGLLYVSVQNGEGWYLPLDTSYHISVRSSTLYTNVCTTGDYFYRIHFQYGGNTCCGVAKTLGTITWMKNGQHYTNDVVIPYIKTEGIVVIHNPGTDCSDATVATCLIAPNCDGGGGGEDE